MKIKYRSSFLIYNLFPATQEASSENLSHSTFQVSQRAPKTAPAYSILTESRTNVRRGHTDYEKN